VKPYIVPCDPQGSGFTCNMSVDSDGGGTNTFGSCGSLMPLGKTKISATISKPSRTGSHAALRKLTSLLSPPRSSRARRARHRARGDKDPDGLIAVAESLSDYVGGKSKEALKKLEEALAACQGAACESGTRAQLWVAIGIVQGAGSRIPRRGSPPSRAP